MISFRLQGVISCGDLWLIKPGEENGRITFAKEKLENEN
jgi:hypothetical protein